MKGVPYVGAPVEQLQRKAEIGLDHEIGVARGGVGDRAEVDDRLEALRWTSQSNNPPGGTMSASWRLARMRHLSSAPKWSLTAMSVRPASFRAATTFDPIKTGPPLKAEQHFAPCPRCGMPSFAPLPPRRQLGQACLVKTIGCCFDAFTRGGGLPTGAHDKRAAQPQIININSEHNVRWAIRGYPPDPDPSPTCGLAISRAATAWRRARKQRWPNRPVDLLVTSLCRRWSIICRAYAPASSGFAAGPAGGGQAMAAGGPAPGQKLRHRAGAAPHLEIGHRPGARRHPRERGLRRRGTVRSY